MADSPVFDFICGQLEERTSRSRLEARGTVRLALNNAGLAPTTLDREQAEVVLDRVLAGELSARGIQDGDDVCAAVRSGVAGFACDPAADSPEAVFARLGGGS